MQGCVLRLCACYSLSKAMPMLPQYGVRRATILTVCTIIDLKRNGERLCTFGSTAVLSRHLRVQQGTLLGCEFHVMNTS